MNYRLSSSMPHPHPGPAPPPLPPGNLTELVTVLLWDPLEGVCVAGTAFSGAGETSVANSCCPGGQFQRADLPIHPGVLIAWLLILCYIFVPGVALSADVFMTSIEVITSKEIQVKRIMADGTTAKHHVRVWNVSVANLTLMALGSSAPEILLSIIEILSNNFYAGALGPSTIVGSAAFNLMVITAVCIGCLPDGETRSIQTLGVFLTTSAYSVFAYVWLVIIVVVWTPNVITVLEGVLTVLYLVVLIVRCP